MSIQWRAVAMRTGVILADLPLLSCDTVSATLGGVRTETASLPVVGIEADDLERITLPYGTVSVLVDDSSGSEVGLWGGIITRRERTLGDTIPLSLSTWETYLDRRYVGDHTYTGLSQTSIVSSLVTADVLDGSVPLQLDVTASATTRDRAYTRVSDKTVLSALTELMGVQGGPEWTITWTHLSAPERWVPVLRVADRIGVPVPASLGPAATFECPGPVTEARFIEDYGSGKGANVVIATSTSSGTDARPESGPSMYADQDRPTVEYRFSPSTSITQTSTLDQHALEAMRLMMSGATALTLTSAVEKAPMLGTDWGMGDDIGYKIQAPAFPRGLVGTARAIGWQMTLTEPRKVTPILAEGDL